MITSLRRRLDRVVLVGVDTDRELRRLGRVRGRDRLEHALPRPAGRVVDDVGTPVELPAGRLVAAHRVVEAARVAGRGEVADVDLDVRGDRLRPRDVAGLELLDQRGLDAADEPDPAGLGLERRRGADQERPLLLGEDQRRDVGQVDLGVDDRELHGGVLGGDGRDRVGVGEADGDDRVEPVGHELAQPRGGGVLALALAGGELAGVVLRQLEVGDRPGRARPRRRR